MEDGCLKFCGTGEGEGQRGDGGDIIFAHKFKNFEMLFDWKVSKGGNSGVFYLAQEVTTEKDGKTIYEPIYTFYNAPVRGEDFSGGNYGKKNPFNHPCALHGFRHLRYRFG